MKKILMAVLAIVAALLSACIGATPLEGDWVFERSADYYDRTPAGETPGFSKLSVHGQEIKLSERCAVRFASTDYYFPNVFQPLTKDDVTAKDVDKFLSKKFGLTLAKTRNVYALDGAPANCARPVMEFFLVGERILIPVGATFYSYVRSQSGAAPSAAQGTTGQGAAVPVISGYKLSRLPMDFDKYFSACRPKILGAKGRPASTERCAPDFFPYVADPKSSDALMKLVGNHDYARFGQEHTSGFSPPFKQKVAATFLVFPPLKQVALVRVDDFEVVRNEERDVMSGVYLSIVGGKVVDQISGCHMNREYVCVADDDPVAKLTESGKFERRYPK